MRIVTAEEIDSTKPNFIPREGVVIEFDSDQERDELMGQYETIMKAQQEAAIKQVFGV